MSKIEVEMHQRINKKLNKIGATSKKATVTSMEAYVVGNIRGSKLKTRNNRHYK